MTTSQERADNLRRLAMSLPHGRHLFWFAAYQRPDRRRDFDTVFTPKTVLSSMWRSAGDEELHSILPRRASNQPRTHVCASRSPSIITTQTAKDGVRTSPRPVPKPPDNLPFYEVVARALARRRSRRTRRRLISSLGRPAFAARRKPFGLLTQDRLRHLYVLGKTGSGKSTLLATLLKQDLTQGHGLALLDPHGDLMQRVHALVPHARRHQITLFAPHREPIACNPFRQGRRRHPSPALLASELIAVFRKNWSEFWGPRLEHVLRNAILAVACDQRANLLFVYYFLTDEQLREKVVAKVKDTVVKHFWTKEFPSYSTIASGGCDRSPFSTNWVHSSRIRPSEQSLARNALDSISFEHMDQGKVLLADLSTGALGEDASSLLGGLLMASIQLAAMSREHRERPFFLYVDEFQHYVSDSVATMLAEARKFGVGLTLAHQYLDQLTPSVRAAVLGNVGSLMLFRTGSQDAATLEGEVAPHFTAADLARTGRFTAVARLIANGTELTPFLARMQRPS